MGYQLPCYLSPELLLNLKHRKKLDTPNLESSDLFSIGLCVIEAALLENIEDIYDFDNFSINFEILKEKITKVKT